jgi:hypothetical protein
MNSALRILLRITIPAMLGLAALYLWVLGGFNQFYFPSAGTGERLKLLTIPCAVAAGLAVWLLRPRAYPPGRCRRCGYDLRGLPNEGCPECGHRKASSPNQRTKL